MSTASAACHASAPEPRYPSPLQRRRSSGEDSEQGVSGAGLPMTPDGGVVCLFSSASRMRTPVVARRLARGQGSRYAARPRGP